MLNTVLWALLTGGVTGAVWIGIVLFQRQARLAAGYRELESERQQFRDELEALHNQLSETQDRLDFVERRLRSGESTGTPPGQVPSST